MREDQKWAIIIRKDKNMSLNLTVRHKTAGEGEERIIMSIPLSTSFLDVFMEIMQGISAESKDVFAVADFGEPKSVKAKTMLTAFREILEKMKDEKNLITYRPNNARSIGVFLIGEELCAVDGGIGTCDLSMNLDKSTGKFERVVDVRDQEYIDTSLGRMKIHKIRPRKLTETKSLHNLCEELEELQPEETLEIIIG